MLMDEYNNLIVIHPEEDASRQILLPGVTNLVMANPAAAIFVADRDITSRLVGSSVTISVMRSLPGVSYGIFDVNPKYDQKTGKAIDIAYSGWVSGDGGTIDFTGLDPTRDYAVRTLVTATPLVGSPMMMGSAMIMHQSAYHQMLLGSNGDTPPDPTKQIHSARVLPMMSETEINVVATGIDTVSGCGTAKIIPYPGDRYTVVNHEDRQIPPLNSAQRDYWGVRLIGSDGKTIPPDADDYWTIPPGLDWIMFILPAGGTYRFGGMTESVQKFVGREMVTLPSIGSNYFVEHIPSTQQTPMVVRIVIDPACPYSMYAAQWGKYAEPDWRRVKPGRTRLIIPVNHLITGRLSAAALPIPLDEMPPVA